MPSAKIRIATMASMRKKPPCGRRGDLASARTAVSRSRRGRIAGGDLPARRDHDASAANGRRRRAGSGRRVRDVDPSSGRRSACSAEAVERDRPSKPRREAAPTTRIAAAATAPSPSAPALASTTLKSGAGGGPHEPVLPAVGPAALAQDPAWHGGSVRTNSRCDVAPDRFGSRQLDAGVKARGGAGELRVLQVRAHRGAEPEQRRARIVSPTSSSMIVKPAERTALSTIVFLQTPSNRCCSARWTARPSPSAQRIGLIERVREAVDMGPHPGSGDSVVVTVGTGPGVLEVGRSRRAGARWRSVGGPQAPS